MTTILNLDQWPRKEHFHFFRKFDEPFFGVTVDIDCTKAYRVAKNSGVSFFLHYLHKTLLSVNAIEPFRYRISDDTILIHDRIDGSATISREDGSFGFSLIEYNPSFDVFKTAAIIEIKRVKNTHGLFTRAFETDNLIHFSALPWINFTSISHARSYSVADSCPKISFGKMMVCEQGRRTMSMSVHVHHGLMDGLEVGKFIDHLQGSMNSK